MSHFLFILLIHNKQSALVFEYFYPLSTKIEGEYSVPSICPSNHILHHWLNPPKRFLQVSVKWKVSTRKIVQSLICWYSCPNFQVIGKIMTKFGPCQTCIQARFAEPTNASGVYYPLRGRIQKAILKIMEFFSTQSKPSLLPHVFILPKQSTDID